MSLSASQERTIEDALDNLDALPDESRRVVEYCIDQCVSGASPEYHEGRPERTYNDCADLLLTVKERFRRRGIELSKEDA
jgi:phage-related protein